MKKILISAGEASGDFYGAELAKQIKKLDKNVVMLGFGGQKMCSAGIDVRLDPVKHAVMGYWEALLSMPVHLGLFFRACAILKKEKPDVLVVIDSPSFHMPLIKEAKRLGIKKVVYYTAPQVWLSRFKRIYELKKYVDLCIVIMPFERELFRKYGMRAEYFGHPSSPFFKAQGKSAKNGETVGIFPGSRNNEIKYFFEDILKTCVIIRAARKKAEFVLFRADTVREETLKKYIDRYPELKIKIVKGFNAKARLKLSAAIAKAGTVTLELAFLGVPEAVVYRVSKTTYFIYRAMKKQKFSSLPNIILQKEVVREFIQSDFVPADVAEEIIKILTKKKYAEKIKKQFAVLRKAHGSTKDVVKNVARAVLKEAKA